MDLELKNNAFQKDHTIPQDYTGDGRNVSPPLEWHDAPSGTQTFGLLCEDPDAPAGTFTHWVIFNLPAQAHRLDEGVPAKATLQGGVIQGMNDFGNVGYGGPAPPPGKPHHYHFKLFALDNRLNLPPGASEAEVLEAMQGHILEEVDLVGTYQRQTAYS